MDNLSQFLPKKRPSNVRLEGHFVTLETLDWARHGPSLSEHIAGLNHADLWTYVPIGPFDDLTGL